MGEPPDAAAPERVMSIYKQYLDLIASGTKTVEVRVGYPSMRRIAAGQLIRFVSGDEECLTRVTRVTEYPSFAAMLHQEDPTAIGASGGREELLNEIRKIYPPEKESLGVLAIEVAREA
ncbi:MAG: ASCH domain-containing protein [Egibacteraceae bacterium]